MTVKVNRVCHVIQAIGWNLIRVYNDSRTNRLLAMSKLTFAKTGTYLQDEIDHFGTVDPKHRGSIARRKK